jgi:mannose-6-phosphate isomerase-like protein (cupin superfamily)
MGVDRQVVAPSTRFPFQAESVIKRFDTPERVLVFDHGRLEVITIGGRALGRGSYGPGWRWSNAARPTIRGVHKPPDHVGVVLSGRARLVIEETEFDLGPGDCFHVATEFESWVLGYRPVEVLYLSGVEALVNRLHRE